MSTRSIVRALLPPLAVDAVRRMRERRQMPDFEGVYGSFADVRLDSGAGFAAPGGVAWAVEKAQKQKREATWRSTTVLGAGDHQFVAIVNHLASKGRAVEVVDVGGGVGNTYLAARPFLRGDVRWTVVELAPLVDAGKRFFGDATEIQFLTEFPPAAPPGPVRIALFRSALQYVPDAEAAIDALLASKAEYFAFLRLTAGDIPDFWSRQRFRGASHPIRFFDQAALVKGMERRGLVLVSRCGDTESLDTRALPSTHRVAQTITLIFGPAKDAGKDGGP